MNILLTGGAGYLGSVLLPKLLVRGHKVRVLDLGYFGIGHLQSYQRQVELHRDDIRRFGTDAEFTDRMLDDIDCVIHLAAISNDPSADLNPQLTTEVNFEATIALAEAARSRGIRLLFSSSCSVYGEADNANDETGSLNPLTTYAVSKVNAEKTLIGMANDNWSPVILRNGTLFGYSPRMRFDLVVNIFSLYSVVHNEIRIFGEGQQWRPFLHVGDCARAFLFLAEKEKLSNIVYNIAHEDLRVVDVAEIFCKLIPGVQRTHVEQTDPDHRDYRVNTDRATTEGFTTTTGVAGGAEEMTEAIICGLIPDPESIYYRNAKWLKELTNIGLKDHKDLMGMMETLSSLRSQSTPSSEI